MTTNTVNRREFLNYLKGGALALAGAKLIGCSPSSSDSGSASAPGLASKFTPQYINMNGTWYATGSTPGVASGARHNTMLNFIPKEDITASIGYVLKDPSGKVEWEWYSQPQLFAKDTVITTPVKSIPIKSSNGGLYDLDARVKVGNETDSLLRVSPQATIGPSVASTLTVKEAIDWLIRQYDGNTNPGIIGVVGNTAPASDVISLNDLTNGILASVASKYGVSGTLPSKLASELASLDNASAFQVGHPTNNPHVNTLLGSQTLTAGYLQAFDLRNGKLHLAVAGTDDLHQRQAARVVAQHAGYNIDWNKVRVEGTTLSDITTYQEL
jgi:hypothetical protein